MDLFQSPIAWAVVLLLTIMGIGFSLPTYYLGRKGMPARSRKVSGCAPGALAAVGAHV